MEFIPSNYLSGLLIWISVLLGMMGIVMLVVSVFLYFLAAGEEPKMAKGNGMLWGGIGCLVGAIAVYSIAKYLI